MENCKNSKLKQLEKRLDLIKNIRGALIPCLQEAQDLYGYLCPDIIDLIANGIQNIHVYSMNKPEVATAIMSNLSEIVK